MQKQKEISGEQDRIASKKATDSIVSSYMSELAETPSNTKRKLRFSVLVNVAAFHIYVFFGNKFF